MGLFSEKIQRVISNFLFVSGVKKRIQAQKKRSGIKSKFQPRPPEDPAVIKARWEKKKDRIHQLAHNISRLRLNVTKDLKSEDEKEFLTVLIIAIIDKTGERIGNDTSASEGHHGVSGFLKKHISIRGSEVTLTYTGKSGVDQEKIFSSEKISKALKKAIRNSPDKRVFTTTEGQRIGSDQVTKYLSDFGITAKDLRGFYVNNAVAEKLQSLAIPETEKERKKLFNTTAKKVATNVGHGCGTCKKHYIVPELSEEYINHGKIIDLKSQNYYKDGGKIEKSNSPLESRTPTPKSEKILLAPNGKPTNLNPIQYRLVRTPEFKRWFGDWENDPENSSKIVDENGEPLVVYHGSKNKFNEFSDSESKYSGWHFFASDKDDAIQFAENKGGNIIRPFFLNAKNPVRNINLQNSIQKGFLDKSKNDSAIQGNINWVVVASSSQAKLADGTNTTFDPNNPDIRYEKGGIPDRYKNMGFSKVGQKKKSTRPQKKWMVLAKKGDKYKVVHGGQKGMEDFSQHRDKNRQKRFWNRMGGFDSEKASDPFSPLYWHKRFGTWEKGGVLEDGAIKVAWIDAKEPETLESKMFDNIDDALKYAEGKTFLIMELEEQDDDYYKWNLLPYGEHERYKGIVNWMNIFEEGGIVENDDFANSENAFLQTQTKSTDEINREFNQNNPDIRYEKEGATKTYPEGAKGTNPEHDGQKETTTTIKGINTHASKEIEGVRNNSRIEPTAGYDNGGELPKDEFSYLSNITKESIQHVLSGKQKVVHGDSILGALTHLRNKGLNHSTDDPNPDKQKPGNQPSQKDHLKVLGNISYEKFKDIQRRIPNVSLEEMNRAGAYSLLRQKPVTLEEARAQAILVGIRGDRNREDHEIKRHLELWFPNSTQEEIEKDYNEIKNIISKVNKLTFTNREIARYLERKNGILEKDSKIIEEDYSVYYYHGGLLYIWNFWRGDFDEIKNEDFDSSGTLTTQSEWRSDIESAERVAQKERLAFYDGKIHVSKQEIKKTGADMAQGGKIQETYKKQIDDYRKEGIFIEPTDNPVVGSLPISRFNGPNADILPSQEYVYRRGVAKWKIKIREGERPHVLINIDQKGTPRVKDGHHRLKAYEELGFTEVPVIDVNGKILGAINKMSNGGMVFNENLAYLLNDAGDTTHIGEEKGAKTRNGISLYKSPIGSYRYVKYINGIPVSAIQVMSRDGIHGYVSNAYTAKAYRRQGHGMEIINKIKKDFNDISLSEDLSGSGRAFKERVMTRNIGDKIKERERLAQLRLQAQRPPPTC